MVEERGLGLRCFKMTHGKAIVSIKIMFGYNRDKYGSSKEIGDCHFSFSIKRGPEVGRLGCYGSSMLLSGILMPIFLLQLSNICLLFPRCSHALE